MDDGKYFLKGVSRLKMRLKTVSNRQISLQIPDTLSHSGHLASFSATYILREINFHEVMFSKYAIFTLLSFLNCGFGKFCIL